MINLKNKDDNKPPDKAKNQDIPDWKREGFAREEYYTVADQTITVRIVQLPLAELQRLCAKGAAECHKVIGGVHTIFIPRLKSDYDLEGQNLLGHGMHHALGMKHPR